MSVYESSIVNSNPDVSPARILFCHCTFAQVVPEDVKKGVLKKLCEANVAFDAVADLCEMAARRDPALARLAAPNGTLKIAACYPRAVKWLFASTQSPLPPDAAEVLNMRVQSVEDVVAALLSPEIHPNIPAGKTTSHDAPIAPKL